MRSDILRRIISTSISIILAIIFVIFIQNFLLRSAIVHTNEMAPTLNKNDYINLTFNNKILIDKIILKVNEKYKYNLSNYESVKLFLNEYLKDLELHNINKRIFYLFL